MNSLTRRIIAGAIVLSLSLYARPVFADQVTLLSIQSGHSVVLKADGLTRVAVGDGRIAGVVPVGTSQVVVNGKTAGHTTIYIWAGGRREIYEVTVTEQQLDDLAQMLRSAIGSPSVQVVNFGNSIVVRGTVSDGAQFQQIADIVARFEPIVKAQQPPAVIVNAVTITQNLGDMQRAIASIPGASGVRVDPDGRGNVIVSGNATDAVTAQAILDRARGLAGPYLASNGQLIDRLNSLSDSLIDIKVYVLEVDKTATSNLGIQLFAAQPVEGQPTPNLVPPSIPFFESIRPPGLAGTIGPFYRTITLAPTLNLMMQEGHAKILSSPDLVTSPGAKATFLVGGSIPVVTSTGLGAINVQYQPYGVQLNVTPTVRGNGSVEAVIAPEVSALDYANAVIVSGFTIPALTISQLTTDVITRPGESILMGGLVQRLEKRTINKIPILSEIPILGKLFTSTSYQNQQSDVVFVLTPEILTR
jgi:Flp pilus assembly secretin CpaC